MYKRYFHLFTNYNRLCVNYHSVSYKFIENCFKKKEYNSFKNRNIQQFTFYNSVASSLLPSKNILESKIINLCIYLRNGRVFYDDLEQVIQIYEKKDYPLLKDVSLVLLKCCGELLPNIDIQTRQRLTKRVWDLIQTKNCPLTLEHYNVLLAVYAQNSEFINPQEFLDNMKIKPDETIYCSLLNVISKMEDYELVSNITLKLGENLFSWNKETFDAVIEAHAMHGNITEAYKMIDKMQSLGIMPSPETYFCLAFGFAKLGDITNIMHIFEKNQPNIEHIMKIIKLISFYGHGKHIPSILKFLTVSLEGDKLSLVNNTIIELIYSGRRAEAFDLITNLPMDAEIIDACVEYITYFVSKEIKLNTSDQDILQIIRELMRNKQFPQIINKATEVALSHGKEALALALFEDMRKNNIPVRSHYYWPLFLKAHKQLDEKPYSLISHMLSLDIEIDGDTFIDYIFPVIDVTNPITTTKTLINIGVNYPVVISSMSAFLLLNNRMKDAISLCSTFKVKLDFRESYLENSLIEGYKKSTSLSTYVPLLLQIPYKNNPPFLHILNALLSYAKDFNELEQLINFLEMLNKQDVKMSTVDVQFIRERINEIKMDTIKIETIQNLLNNMNNEETHLNFESDSAKSGAESILSPMPHPKKMNSEELQNHIVELENKNMHTRGSIKRLLHEYCAQNNLKGAEKLKQIIISNDFEWTPGMSAHLFNLYLKNNLLDKAEAELTEIQNKFSNFQIDNSKILLYAIALVKNNRLEDAFDAINNIKNVNKRVQVDNKCFQLLSTIADSEHYDSTEEMLNTLVKNNYCKISNILLIPLLLKHLSNNDIESAVDVFIHCAKKYKQTPLKQKVVLHLVKNLDSSVPNTKNNLSRVIDCICEVNGESVAIVHLIEAFAETRQMEKLQNIFQMHEVNMQVLSHHFQKHFENHKHVLLTIFEAILNIERVSKSPLCDLMISVYEKSNDYEAATTLLRKMEENNITPSNYFKQKFDYLVANCGQQVQNEQSNKQY